VLLHDGPLGAKATILMGARPRRLRPAIISFSGLDGSGKSTQVGQLRDCLGQLGVSSEVQWAGFKSGKRWRARIPLLDRPTGTDRHSQPSNDLVPTALQSSRFGRQAWAFVVVGLNTAHLWRLVLRRRGDSKVLIFDRFSPDSMVKLDLRFHRLRQIDIRWQRRLFTLISPKPDLGFLVDVPSQVAYSRRQDHTPEELATTCELYHEQVARFDLHRLDGTQAPDALSERVAVAAWRGLR
jgi:thymidylate kinase